MYRFYVFFAKNARQFMKKGDIVFGVSLYTAISAQHTNSMNASTMLMPLLAILKAHTAPTKLY